MGPAERAAAAETRGHRLGGGRRRRREPLRTIAPLASPAEAKDRRYEAVISWEPDNPVDPEAIVVTIGCRPVGHLGRDAAAVYRAALTAAGHAGRDATCRAYVTPLGPRGLAGVKLDLTWPPQIEAD
jgi:hypothetical protein